MSQEIALKMDKNLLDEVKQIAKIKFPLRKIEFYSEAVKEALIEFVKKNQRYKKKDKPTENSQQESIIES